MSFRDLWDSVEKLSGLINLANWGIALTLLAAFACTVIVIKANNRKDELTNAEDLRKATQVANLENSNLTLRGQIATLETQAADAKRKQAEAETAFETFRAQQANPRMIVLYDRDGDHLERSRRASEVKKFSGTHVLIQSLPDFEPRTLANAIAIELANEYKWQVEMIDSERSRIPFLALTPGVKVITLEESGLELGDPATAKVKIPTPAKSRSYPAALALVNLLDLDLGEPYGPQYFGIHWEAEYDDPRFRTYTHWGFELPRDAVLILVGAKPITGAAEIHKTKTKDIP